MKLRTKIYFRLKNYPYNMTAERMVEIPFIIKNLPLDKNKMILDVGCDESILPVMLCSYGYNVFGIDINQYNFKHPKFRFEKINLCKLKDVKNSTYDIVISMSTIEHMGLGYYGEDNCSQSEAFDVIYDILKEEGMFILTVPFGKYSENKLQRVYNKEMLNKVLKKFKISKLEFYMKEGNIWIPCLYSSIENLDSTDSTNGITCIVCQKVKNST